MNNDLYLNIDLLSIPAGISHHMSNYAAMIKYCYENKIKLIKPRFKLTAAHNNGKEIISDLSMYYDLDNILVNNEKFTLYSEPNIVSKMYSPPGGLLRLSAPFNCIKNNYDISFPYNKTIIQLANDIVKKIGTEFMCIHVRRGDRITTKQIDIDTQPPNILNKIKENNASTVYIMTNKINELKALRNNKEHKIYFFDDFEELKAIKDNYYLFSIENAIMDLASIRCSTFNAPQKKYHCYLTSAVGWQ